MNEKLKGKKRSRLKVEAQEVFAETVDKAVRPVAGGFDHQTPLDGAPKALTPPTQELDADRAREEQRRKALQELAGGVKIGIDKIDVQLRSILLSISRQVGNLGTENITPDELHALHNIEGQIRAAVNSLRATGQNAIELHNNVGPLQVCEPWANRHATPHRMCALR